MGGKYLTTGHLVWFWAGSLLAAPFDLDRLEVRGAPVPLLSGVDRDGWRGGNAAISDSGTLAYVPGQAYEPKALMAVDMEGRERTILPMGPYRPLDVSPDGTKLLVSKHDSGGLDWSLWTYDMSSGVWARVLDGSGGTSNAVWGPDGSVIASTDRHGGRFANLYKVSVANEEERRLTRNEAFGQFPQSWSAAANAVLFSEGVHPDTNLDIYALPLSGNAKPVPLVNSAGCETNPVFSPDGKWLAYTYRDAPDASVRIRPYPANTAEIALETGSAGPTWSRDGREIYYRLGQAMMAVPFHSGRLGQPRKLFEGPYAGPEYWNINAVLTPDGKQFLLLKYSEDMPANRRLHVVVNWSTELKRVGNSR
jgi:Tol biopolymer transport system component